MEFNDTDNRDNHWENRAREDKMQIRARALTVPCPQTGCHAATGDECINSASGAALKWPPAHTNRIDAATMQGAGR